MPQRGGWGGSGAERAGNGGRSASLEGPTSTRRDRRRGRGTGGPSLFHADVSSIIATSHRSGTRLAWRLQRGATRTMGSRCCSTTVSAHAKPVVRLSWPQQSGTVVCSLRGRAGGRGVRGCMKVDATTGASCVHMRLRKTNKRRWLCRHTHTSFAKINVATVTATISASTSTSTSTSLRVAVAMTMAMTVAMTVVVPSSMSTVRWAKYTLRFIAM